MDLEIETEIQYYYYNKSTGVVENSKREILFKIDKNTPDDLVEKFVQVYEEGLENGLK